jgi:deoxyadenosine/deoxycytidine kinase
MLNGCRSGDIIVFLGTVGSGKSTQMMLLGSTLRKNGLRVKTVSLKTNHIFARLLAKVLASVLEDCRKDTYPIRTLIEDEPQIFRSLFSLWLFLDLFSISLKFFFAVLLPKKLGYTILAEEYIPAAICDYMYISKALDLPMTAAWFAMELLLRLQHVGGPAQVVFLDAEQDVLESRWRTRGTQSERTDYLFAQRSTLLPLSKKLSTQVFCLNTSERNMMETHKLLADYFAR